MAAKHKPKGVAARARSDRAFLKKALADPGLRSKLDASQLPAAMRQRRELNARLNAPITPGSPTTERDLAHAAQAATSVRYGPQERQIGEQIGISQTTERDTGSFYDEYQRQLAAHAANVAAFQQGAQQALAQTAQGITGLSGAEGAAMQQQANAGAAQQGVAQAGNLMPDANAATAVRQALIGSFQGQQALQGAGANTYADTMANVVAPTQKLSARAQAAGKTRDLRKTLTDLRSEEGAFNQQFRDTRRQDEFKNVLAQQTLGANVANQQADNAIAASKAASDAASKTPQAAAAKTSATASATQAAKYGYTAHQWALLGPTARAKIIKDAKKSTARGGSDTVYTQGPFAGRKKSEIAALSDAQRQKIVNDYNRGKGKPKQGKGPDWQPQAKQSAARSQVVSLKNYAAKAKRGEAFVAGHRPSGPLPRNGPNSASAKIQQAVAAPDDPILVTAALDAVYNNPPGLSASTVRALIAAGYKPSQIAQALGVPTSGGRRSAARTSRTTRPGSGPAAARR